MHVTSLAALESCAWAVSYTGHLVDELRGVSDLVPVLPSPTVATAPAHRSAVYFGIAEQCSSGSQCSGACLELRKKLRGPGLLRNTGHGVGQSPEKLSGGSFRIRRVGSSRTTSCFLALGGLLTPYQK